MTYTIMYEKINDESFPANYYYAHIPSLDITTHGLGIEGAKKAAIDILKLWLEEKKAQGERVKKECDSLISTIELEDALFS